MKMKLLIKILDLSNQYVNFDRIYKKDGLVVRF
ncbi:hypothetical protein CoNPh35_CDS0023 [Staphylococcus phage S-CoN_Ph35]|nr:hypothetical protein CoNPh35_CDS0023 [Staphylococcus phage S-CoN_Ph35]